MLDARLLDKPASARRKERGAFARARAMLLVSLTQVHVGECAAVFPSTFLIGHREAGNGLCGGVGDAMDDGGCREEDVVKTLHLPGRGGV